MTLAQKLAPFIHPDAVEPLEELLQQFHFTLKIVRGRKTKRGDFRPLPSPTITINNNLNPEQFLITLVHEVAHLKVFLNYKKVQPHGKEWKSTFKEIMLPFLQPTIFSEDILKPLAKYLINPKASTDNDTALSTALAKKYHTDHTDVIFVSELPLNSSFVLQDRTFKVLEKRRTRYECIDLSNRKRYWIKGNAEVKKL